MNWDLFLTSFIILTSVLRQRHKSLKYAQTINKLVISLIVSFKTNFFNLKISSSVRTILYQHFNSHFAHSHFRSTLKFAPRLSRFGILNHVIIEHWLKNKK